MRVAALYDIHGNLPALEAVLAEVAAAAVDGIVVGGDVVAGPLPAETLAAVTGLPGVRFVRGNADREVVAGFDVGRVRVEEADGPPGRAAAFAAAALTRGDRDVLAAFEETVVLDVDGLGATLFCHSTPRSDTEVLTTATTDERMASVLDGVAEPVVVCGHTHRQFDRRAGGRRVVNAGSVGSPYEGRPGAYWALLGPGVSLRRTAYDLEAAAARLRAGGYPDLDELLRESQTEPVDPDEVAAFFERLATSAPDRAARG